MTGGAGVTLPESRPRQSDPHPQTAKRTRGPCCSHLCQVILQVDSEDPDLWGQNISKLLPGPRVLTLPSNYPLPGSSPGPGNRSPTVDRQQELISRGAEKSGLRIPLPWQLLQVFLKGTTRPRGWGCIPLPFRKSKSKRGHRVTEASSCSQQTQRRSPGVAHLGNGTGKTTSRIRSSRSARLQTSGLGEIASLPCGPPTLPLWARRCPFSVAVLRRFQIEPPPAPSPSPASLRL